MFEWTTEGAVGSWIKSLVSQLSEISSKRQREIENINDKFPNVIELAKHYIDPNLQNINPADENEEQPTYSAKMPAIAAVNKFLEGSATLHQDGRSHLFIFSDAGMGKTSLLMMIKLLNLTSFWPSKYKCKLFKLEPDTLDAVNLIQDKASTVLLLDALDEDSSSWDGTTRDRISDILQSTSAFHRVIISCRTQFFPYDPVDPFKRAGRLAINGYNCPVLFLSYFDDDQVDQYLKNVFKLSTKGGRESYSKSMDVIKKMGSLRFRPLLLSYIDVISTSPIAKWTEFEIFETLVRAWLDREYRKPSNRKLSSFTDDLLLACQYVALYIQVNSKDGRTITEYGLRDVSNVVPAAEAITYFELGGRSLMNRTSNGYYRFAHYAIQEFLIAYGVIHGNFKAPDNSIRTTDFMLDMIGKHRTSKSKISQLNFSEANLSKWTFKNETIENISFSRTNLEGVTFDNCCLKKLNFNSAHLSGTSFKMSKIIESEFANIESNIGFENAQITGCIFRRSKYSESNFDYCQIDNSNFTNIEFSPSSFVGARLSDSIFSDCDFRNSILKNVQVLNVEMENVKLKNKGDNSIVKIVGKNLSIINTKVGKAFFRDCDIENLTIS